MIRLKMYLGDIYTIAVNLAGLAGNLRFRVEWTQAGLPIGMQMIGDCFQEKKIIRAAAAYEAVQGSMWHPTLQKGGR